MIAFLKQRFFQPDNATWRRHRLQEASSLAVDHTRLAVEADEAAQWATVQAQHHRAMAAMYEARVACLTNAD